MSEIGKPSDQPFRITASLKDMSEKIDNFDSSVRAIKSGGSAEGFQVAEKEVQDSITQAKIELKAEADSVRVKAIHEWLDSKTRGGTNSISKYAEGSPAGITESDLQQALLEIRPRGNKSDGFMYDIRSYYITGLAQKIVREKISRWMSRNPNASDIELEGYKNNVSIELTHPEIGDASWEKMKNIGYGWEEGKLVLNGNFGESTASGMHGGKIVVKGTVGPRAGSMMQGGELDINGVAEYELGFGMNGGYIHANRAAPGVGNRMHGGLIEVDDPIDEEMRGSGTSFKVNILAGDRKEGGEVIIAGKTY